MRKFSLVFCIAIFCSSFASGLDLATDVDFINLSAWDHLSTKTGQMFEDVWGDVDLNIRAYGDFQLASHVRDDYMLISPNEIEGTHNFLFKFSEPVPLVVQHWSTDDTEIVTLIAEGISNYTHQYGRPGDLTDVTGGMQLQGTSRRITEDGAARGYFEIAPVSQFTLSHTALSAYKFEAFRVGVITNTPEPNGIVLLMVSALGLLRRARRHRD